LEEIYQKYEIETHAYCMMKNHYHLLLKTPKANVSKGMWYLGCRFAKLVNQDIHSDGPLFKSRFRSIILKDDRYLLQVSRYIHLNPVVAGLVATANMYPWSSFQYFVNWSPTTSTFLKTAEILSRFRSPEEYEEFVEIGNSTGLLNFYNRKNIPTTITAQSF
jgi:REP element-mobilizing transposase RayT